MILLHPFLDYAAPIPFVHRGGPTGLPENTLVAFENAYTLGFRYFETDVHATSDGVLVAFHDRSLKRLTGEKVPIASLTRSQVEAVRIEGEQVPLLEDLLAHFPEAKFNIDAKSDATIRPLVDVLLRQKVLGRVCLASFNDGRLRWLRLALGRQACTAAGPREIARACWASRRGRRIQLPGVDVLQIPLGPSQLPLLNDRFLQAAHDAELPVHVWTVNRRGVIERLLDLGVDGIMSDNAETLREVFVSRGIWRDGQP